MTCRERSLSQPILARCGWCVLRAASGWLRAFTCIQAAAQPQTTLVPIRPSAAFPWRPRIKSPVVVVTTTTTTLSLSTTTKRTSHVSLCEGSSFCSTVSLGRASSALPLFIGFFFCPPLLFPRSSLSPGPAVIHLRHRLPRGVHPPNPNPYRYHHQLPPPVHAALLVNDLLELVVVGLVRLHVVECLS